MSMQDRKIALIVAADEPALFFTSIKAAESYLETIDVENYEYSAAYDPDGRLYQIGTSGKRVVITPERDQPSDPAALKALLLGFLSEIGEPGSEADSLETLIKRCERYVSA